MTKDYARKKQLTGYKKRRPSSRTASPSTLGPSIGLILGLVIGMGATALYFYQGKWTGSSEQPPPPPIRISTSSSEPHVKAPVENPSSASVQEPSSSPRFDFYTLLPNMSVEIPDVATPENANRTTLNPNPDTPSELAYIIQAGSFKQLEKADALQAQLALVGFEAHIQTVKIKTGETWYRVYIGPFDSQAAAKHVQQEMEAFEALNSLVLKIRV